MPVQGVGGGNSYANYNVNNDQDKPKAQMKDPSEIPDGAEGLMLTSDGGETEGSLSQAEAGPANGEQQQLTSQQEAGKKAQQKVPTEAELRQGQGFTLPHTAVRA